MDVAQNKLGTVGSVSFKATDVRIIGAELYLLPVLTRVPLSFGAETLTSVTCARVRIRLTDRTGRVADGWGECPLNVQWAWPGAESYNFRHEAMISFCCYLAHELVDFDHWGHPLEISDAFQTAVLPTLRSDSGLLADPADEFPELASLVCLSAFDLALHDAYGCLHQVPVYDTYRVEFLNKDLSDYFGTNGSSTPDFRGIYPDAFLAPRPRLSLPVWHLVGVSDPLDENELTGKEARDRHPLLLSNWIEADGLTCLKIKLKGQSAEWDYMRLCRTGKLALERQVEWLAADFNCCAPDVEYVVSILDRLAAEEPEIFAKLLYLEQPFPHEVVTEARDVRGISERKPLLMDESAHNWRLVELGRTAGWTGVALKTCKTQTSALLSHCWAKAHNMPVMVQDLTNPMLATIPHALLAAYCETMMGLECNAMQFYPAASLAEAKIHPGLYCRRNGQLDLSTIHGPGFGYRLDEIRRALPPATLSCGDIDREKLRVGS